ncbi:MAG: putative ATP-binding cassette transporter [Alteromonadaceae bacterium]|jgi:putative ATP-binding cassette transporter
MFKELYLKYKWYLLFTIPMSILLGSASMSIIAIISDAIGSGIDKMDYGRNAFFFAILTLFVIGMINELLRAKLFASIIYDIQVKMIRRVSATPLPQLETIGLSKVTATLTEDVAAAVNYFHVLPVIFVNIAIVSCGMIYMAYLSVELLFVVLACIIFIGITIAILIISTKKDRVKVRNVTDDMFSHYQQLVQGSKELTLNLHRNAFFNKKVFSTARTMKESTHRIFNILALLEQWSQLAVFAVIGSVIFIIGNYLSLSSEVIIGYVITLLFLLEPIEIIVNGADQLVEAKVAFNKIDSLKLTEVDGWDEDQVLPTPKMNKHNQVLSLKNVEYLYGNEGSEGFTLGPISVDFNPGEISLIVGGNGSGKSTLLKIISGLYESSSGTITFGDNEITSDNLEDFRNHFSMITSDFCLFEDVLDEFGKPCQDARVNSMLDKLYLSKVAVSDGSKISNLDLSQGQRKRLALLQTYFESRPIVILDEWAADQDPIFKKIFYEDILRKLKSENKTVILVSHDDQYFHVADRMFKVKEGQLVENSSFEKMHNESKLYEFDFDEAVSEV